MSSSSGAGKGPRGPSWSKKYAYPEGISLRTPIPRRRSSRISINEGIPARRELVPSTSEAMAASTGDAGPYVVVGIDYGTTFTGLAWAQISDDVSEPTLDQVQCFSDWPERKETKVPSVLSYSRSSGQYHQWGHSIDPATANVALQWTKLELQGRSPLKELEKLLELTKGMRLANKLQEGSTLDPPRHLARNDEDIIRDYLAKVARHWYRFVQSKQSHLLENVPVDVVVTHPAGWTYEAKNKTVRAVLGSFTNQMLPLLRNIFVTTEPEACALYTIRDLLGRDLNTLVGGDCFIVCDCGGGTVDLVAYQVECLDPLELKIIGAPAGAQCGATYVDRGFLRWLSRRITNVKLPPHDLGAGGHTAMSKVARVCLASFEPHKRAFASVDRGCTLQLPRGAVATPEYPDAIQAGMMRLTGADMKEIFSYSVDETVALIARQMGQVQSTISHGVHCQVTNVFMAGGFSENEYLLRSVKNWASGYQIDVKRAQDCWGGVAKGAVLKAIGMGAGIASKVWICRRSYGVCVSRSYENWRDFKQKAVKNAYHGQRQVTDQITWMVNKGDVIFPGDPLIQRYPIRLNFTKKHYEEGGKLSLDFTTTGMDDPPTVLRELPQGDSQVHNLAIDLSRIPVQNLQSGKRRSGVRHPYSAEVEAMIVVDKRVDVTIIHKHDVLAHFATNL
ncbi:hypothetical protein EJ06DRAFT_268430 [Trichodelitschia bisporula]|uniref:Actin-like ATPase domain-containing protein n=1 Tax=Trichodelitschia bisporula TaxID=703511 RepID=A0A6G1HHN5_9PEZI|nr:hypothetical protein EJ06DRAFT_268430 [Trichodelitschia bisporula]